MTNSICAYPALSAAGPLRIGGLTAPLPIVQGGMGVGVSLSGLASAVANQGGIGVISAACLGRTPRYEGRKLRDHQALEQEIALALQLSPQGIIGVNIMVALADYQRLVLAASQAGADILFAGAGLPLDLPGLVAPGSSTALVPIISSAKAAALILRWWREKYQRYPDAFVVEGPMAGGHLGFKTGQMTDPGYSLDQLIVQVRQELDKLKQSGGPDIPLIAAGGVFSGDDIGRCLRLGAQGVQLGTRFVVTAECDAPLSFKQAYLDAQEADILVVQSPVGMPGRALKNRFIEGVERGERSPTRCRYRCISSCKKEKSVYCIADALLRSLQGDAQEGLIFIGAKAWRLGEMSTVPGLLAELDQGLAASQHSEGGLKA